MPLIRAVVVALVVLATLTQTPLSAQEGLFISSRSVKGGNGSACDECAEGVWRAQLVRYVRPGRYAGIDNPPCDRDLPPWTRAIGKMLYGVMTGGAPDSAGIVEMYLAGRQKVIDTAIQQAGIRGTVGEFLGFVEGLEQASCEYLGIVLPKNARVVDVKLGLHNNAAGGAECSTQGGNCLPWTYNTAVVQDLPLVWVVSKNWSHDRLNTANFRVYYRP